MAVIARLQLVFGCGVGASFGHAFCLTDDAVTIDPFIEVTLSPTQGSPNSDGRRYLLALDQPAHLPK